MIRLALALVVAAAVVSCASAPARAPARVQVACDLPEGMQPDVTVRDEGDTGESLVTCYTE